MLPVLLLLLLSCNAAYGAIIKVEQLSSIREILSDAGAGDLVVFDVDQTLIIPDDKLLRPCGDQFLQTCINKFQSQLSEERLHELTSKVLLQRTLGLVDAELPHFIKALRHRQCKVMALTAMVTGRLGTISSMEDWRFDELKQLDIDFSSAFPLYNHIVFGDIMQPGSLPIFKNGILCSARHSKGEVLSAFLQRVKWKPQRVFFIDDHLHFVESVQEHMRQAGIEFTGIHYRAAGTFDEVLDQELALAQIAHLIHEDEWLSDAQMNCRLTAEH